jgi:hypothetical protein
MKKRNNHRLDQYIFDNGKEYLLKVTAKHKLIRQEFVMVATLSVYNIKDYFAYTYIKPNVKTAVYYARTTINLHNPIEEVTTLDCSIYYKDLEFLIQKIKNMNKRRYKKTKMDLREAIKSRSEILDIS